MSQQSTMVNYMVTTPAELVQGMVKLVSLPHICIRVNLMVEDPNYSTMEIGQIIGQDASLTARLLKLANSPFYGFQSKIETVSRAIMVIGHHELRDLVIAVSAVRTFNKIPMDLANMASFWRHSMFCAIVSRLLAQRCHVLHPERLFIAGLLHDIGQLIIFHKLPDAARHVLSRVSNNEELFHAEQELLAFSHADVGAELMKSWQLPASLQETIKFHHNPDQAPNNPLEAAIVNIANYVTNNEEFGGTTDHPCSSIDPCAWKITNLSEDIVAEVKNEAYPLLFEGLALIMPN